MKSKRMHACVFIWTEMHSMILLNGHAQPL